MCDKWAVDGKLQPQYRRQRHNRRKIMTEKRREKDRGRDRDRDKERGKEKEGESARELCS